MDISFEAIATGAVRVSPASLLLAYNVLQFSPLVLQSDQTINTLFPDAAIEGVLDNVGGLSLTLIGVLKVLPPSILAAKNVSESRPVGEVLKSCHVTYTLAPDTAITGDLALPPLST